MVEGFSTPEERSEQVMLEANLDYWDILRFPRLQRIIFNNTIEHKKAVELVKTTEGRIDLVSGLSPLETLRVAQSPYAQVVKNRGALMPVFGQFNMRKVGSPWHDRRLRQAVNLAINREHLIRYATKGNGLIIPALVPVRGFGYNSELAPYPFAAGTARQLLQEAGYPNGLALILIAPEDLEIQATVVSKMLEQVGFTVDRRVLKAVAYMRTTRLSELEQPPAAYTWDIALTNWSDLLNFPIFEIYQAFALDGPNNWGIEAPELRRLVAQVLGTTSREGQQALIRQMERLTHDQAYFLFLYNPIQLFAVNKAVAFVPYVTTVLNLAETSVTAQHWSVRKQGPVHK